MHHDVSTRYDAACKGRQQRDPPTDSSNVRECATDGHITGDCYCPVQWFNHWSFYGLTHGLTNAGEYG